jgi:hypothetical protein
METQSSSSGAQRATRHQISLELEFKRSYGRQSEKANIKSISINGALVQVDQPLRIGERLKVTLSVSDRVRKVPARVVYVGGEKEVGIRFEPFNNRDLQIVDDIIYFATEKSSTNRSLLENILSKVS